ncbi:hypothetical protein [Deinococcus ruber]|uniref:hypothetical protein n=1 Tax=Deinococcus ruber TaxID=1848197 RepID=UPI00166F011A|nr:hypothetical protein [Deinococcus ruber]
MLILRPWQRCILLQIICDRADALQLIWLLISLKLPGSPHTAAPQCAQGGASSVSKTFQAPPQIVHFLSKKQEQQLLDAVALEAAYV